MTILYNNIPADARAALPSSADGTITFFNNYYKVPIEINESDLTAMMSYFTSRGYGEQASQSIAIIILTQAKKDNLNPFDILGTLQGFSDVQLSALVGEVLNNNRFKSSNLGVTNAITTSEEVLRNILA